jgi:hypothetical protein
LEFPDLLPQDLSCTSKYPYETGLGPVATLASPILAIRKKIQLALSPCFCLT